ncbi:MAG: efflux RND transporter periplasmic adaptor subunit [Acidobacteria bacterium]|nr:efflux RND transporter periplasmic adaptor subunit [Acidobacteriota bacterium]
MKEQLDELRIDRTEESDETLKKQRRRWISVVLLALLVLAAIFWWVSRPRAAAVQLATAREVTVGGQRTVLNASGYVTARRRATVSSKITGKVLEVLIEEGMEVTEGQVLARLDSSNAAALVSLGAAQLRAARSDSKETRVRLAEARLDLERTEKLAVDRIASQAELDRARARVDSWAARLESQGESVLVAERSLAVSRRALDDTVIRAPFDGVVVAKNAQPGEMISPVSSGGFTRTGIGTIVDMSSLEIEVDVNEAYINRVVPGQRVESTLDSYSDWKIPSSVIAIIPTADRSTATVKVRIGFDELDSRILPDMGVKVAFQGVEQQEGSSTRAASAVVVPIGAIRNDGNTDLVFVVADGRVERRAVRLGDTDGNEAFVLSGLRGGDRVVLTGPAELKDGDVVEEIGQ